MKAERGGQRELTCTLCVRKSIICVHIYKIMGVNGFIFLAASDNVARWKRYFFFALVVGTLTCCEKTNKTNTDAVVEDTKKIEYHFVNKFPHDTTSLH